MAKTTIKNWDKEAVIALIKVYKNKPCLYNLKSPDYYNRDSSRDALAEMVQVVSPYYPKVTEEDCRKKYQSLRNQFCKEYAKVLASKDKSDSQDLYTPKLWCYEQLVFLKGSIYRKKGSFAGCLQENQDDEDYFPSDEAMVVQYMEESAEDFETIQPEKTVNSPKTSMKKRKFKSASSQKVNSVECSARCASPLAEPAEETSPEIESLSSTLQMYFAKKAKHTLPKNKYTAFGDFVGMWLHEIENKKTRKQAMCDIINIIVKYEMDDSD